MEGGCGNGKEETWPAFQNLISLMTAWSLELNNECFDVWELFVNVCICQYAVDSKVEITGQCND